MVNHLLGRGIVISDRILNQKNTTEELTALINSESKNISMRTMQRQLETKELNKENHLSVWLIGKGGFRVLGNIKIGLWSNEEKVMCSDKACPEVMGASR